MRNENDYYSCDIVIVVAATAGITHVGLFFCGEEARRKEGVASSGVLRSFCFWRGALRRASKPKQPYHHYMCHLWTYLFRYNHLKYHMVLLRRCRPRAGMHVVCRTLLEAPHEAVLDVAVLFLLAPFQYVCAHPTALVLAGRSATCFTNRNSRFILITNLDVLKSISSTPVSSSSTFVVAATSRYVCFLSHLPRSTL